jgi:hypothetical protein
LAACESLGRAAQLADRQSSFGSDRRAEVSQIVLCDNEMRERVEINLIGDKSDYRAPVRPINLETQTKKRRTLSTAGAERSFGG